MVIAGVARVNFREFIGYGMIFAVLWFVIGVRGIHVRALLGGPIETSFILAHDRGSRSFRGEREVAGNPYPLHDAHRQLRSGRVEFAALVKVDGRAILFDTGARPDTVLINTRALAVDLSGIGDVILSHNHADHTGGLVTLRRAHPKALGRAHVGRGIFLSRLRGRGGEGNSMIDTRRDYEALGGSFVEHTGFAEIAPGVWVTGPVPRKHPERNWSGSGQLRDSGGKLAEDNLPEDMSMVIETAQGLVLISGCGHAGMINTIEHIRTKFGDRPLHAAIGGFHLFRRLGRTLGLDRG